MQGGYHNATSAAAAAREYYLQAKLASEAAERWAQGQLRLPIIALSEPCSKMYEQMYTCLPPRYNDTTVTLETLLGKRLDDSFTHFLEPFAHQVTLEVNVRRISPGKKTLDSSAWKLHST